MHYYEGFGKRSSVGQDEPIPGKGMAKNNAGGYVFEIDDLARLHRFLILGSDSATHYTGQRELTRENLASLERLMHAGRGIEAVDLIAEIADGGRAPSDEPALFALARLCACDVQSPVVRPVAQKKVYTLHGEHNPELFVRLPSDGDVLTLYQGKKTLIFSREGESIVKTVLQEASTLEELHPMDAMVRSAAWKVLPKVARNSTRLFHFLTYVKQFRGTGRAYRRAVSSWYSNKSLQQLSYQAIKYQNRDGWTHKDALRLSHPKPAEEVQSVYGWMVKKTLDSDAPLLHAYAALKAAPSASAAARLIADYRLPREAVPTQFLSSPNVWEALLHEMPLEAMIRNLATMTRNGVLAEKNDVTREVVARLYNGDWIRAARVHPIKILSALLTYQQGHGMRAQNKIWQPIPQIAQGLEGAFYLAFKGVVPTHKRILVGVDVSSSMGSGTLMKVPNFTPRMGAAALSLITISTEDRYQVMAFQDTFVPLSIKKGMLLGDVVRLTGNLSFGATDCAMPMIWATTNHQAFDAFIVLTDNETWTGRVHPIIALEQYKQKSGINAKLVVVAMTATGFSIAEPGNPTMLDVAGFDSAMPDIIGAFVREDFAGPRFS